MCLCYKSAEGSSGDVVAGTITYRSGSHEFDFVQERN